MLLPALLLALQPAAWTGLRAQTPESASLKGRVLDEAGQGLPGVVVKLSSRTPPVGVPAVITDLEGHYAFNLLQPGGTYTLTASIPDYATVEAGPLEVRAGRVTRLDLTMRRSSDLQETVKVVARGEMVALEETSTSSTFNSEFIEGVPLVGRSFSDLLTLAPGVTDPDGDGKLNVRGARDTGLQLRIDGTNVTNPLTGAFGQDVNLESVEEIEIITAGASAEYGRADGGFANVITKSGGNELSGSLKVFYRSQFLDGRAVGDGGTFRFTDLDLHLTAGGALVKDHLWYFAALQRVDEERPVKLPEGEGTVLESSEGWRNFAKLTWQASPSHKLALQINHDPLDTLGNNIGPNIAAESDFLLATGGSLPQLTWTAILSPSLLMQTSLSHLNTRAEIEPVSGAFQPLPIGTVVDSAGVVTVQFPCNTLNCVGDDRFNRFFFVRSSPRGDQVQSQSGAYFTQAGADLTRTTLRADLSYTIEEAAGQHAVKTGFQYDLESYGEGRVTNPILTDRTCGSDTCAVALPFRLGSMTLQVYEPLRSVMTAESFNVGAYAQDSWKPRPNLTVNAGVRFDLEQIDTEGFTYFSPAEEAVEALRRYDLVCSAFGPACEGTRTPGRRDGDLPGVFAPPPGHPALQFDVNGDGLLTLAGDEGAVLYEPFTTDVDRLPDAFFISNVNLAPRFSVSWDPWADGRTKVFGTYGVYYDRLFLGSVVTDQDPSWYVAEWLLGGRADLQAFPGRRSTPLTPVVSIGQTDRDLATPYTTEYTFGFERELAPEWSVAVSFVHREGSDLLQDRDVNHITCEGFDNVFGVDPMAVCGDGGFLELDRFGGRSIAASTSSGAAAVTNVRNGAVDLYHLNPNFNQVLRVTNSNASRYTSWELALRKRLHRNWQMHVGYTWSTAEGDAESFDSAQGNDPAVSDKVGGYLDYDQRHVFKWQTVTHLPREILLGASVTWASGLPYTFVRNEEDLDDVGSLTPQRIFSITGRKNDQRNASQLSVDGRVEKRLNLGRWQASAFLSAENLMGDQELILRQVDRDRRDITDGQERLGRRWEIGASILF